jgi:arginyl-tRNA synthetase
MGPLEELRTAVEDAASDLRNGKPAPAVRPTLERPKKAGFGDYSTNAAMLLAPALGAKPRDIAEQLAGALSGRLGERVERVEVAGPGFLNVFLADAWYVNATRGVLQAGDDWGHGEPETRLKVNVEYVSANPTGPMTAASARHAAYGDALARMLELSGHDVSREYYFNNAGGQINRLGASVGALARGEEVPEDGYKGDYVAELAQQIANAAERSDEELGAEASSLIMEGIRETLHAYRVDFDTYFLEGSLHEGDPSPIDLAFDRLREQGHLYESDGALWLRTTEFGDDKDRVLKRQTGAPTYFAADVAYQEDKFRRGFDKAIYVLGADHHGYIARLKAIAASLGEDPERVEVPILQFVHIVEGGDRAKMSKRAGDFVRLSELIERIGVDASRWFMLSRSHDSTIDLDLDLAAKQDPENPVYYVQMMHARIAGIFRQLPEGRVDAALAADTSGVALNDAERELIRKVLAFPHEVREAVTRRAPHRIASYALELGQSYASFYRDSPVRDEPDEAVQSFRIALSVATRRTLASALTLLGVSAPESM